MTIIGFTQKGGSREIMAICSYAAEEDHRAEVAFVVREDFHGLGICSFMLKTLEEIAKENNYTEFSASVLRENAAMIRVFKKRYPHAKVLMTGGSDVMINMDFNDAVEPVDKISAC